ncbi:MAG: IS30 family transposase [Bacteroidales bacterium]|nr:IS30 family transposase [Bacteroidales bacterium]MCF8457268.1 IS30 family transposase [Bacteroidales bacterium]
MKHLTKEQRYTISVMKSEGYKKKQIAKAIGKDKSTVTRELLRNSDGRNSEYRHDLAQRKSDSRHESKPKKLRFTEQVKQHVDKWLLEDYSPEQITGRAKLDGLDCVSHERIYQYVWKDKKDKGTLYLHLRRKGRKYRKRGSAKDSRGIIKNRVDISQRPAIVDDKMRIGDLEIDTVIGKNHKGALLTVTDRVSSFLWMAKLNGKNAQELALKTIEILSPLKEICHTITGDNGKEFAEHQTIAKGLLIDFFFAAPYHSWERGANENTNGLIRQYFPKGSSFENITKKDIQNVQYKLNTRPRKKLGFLSPIEFLSLYLTNQKVAFIT